MILLCGIPSEEPLDRVRAELDRLAVPSVLFNQRQFAEMDLMFELSQGQVTGYLDVCGRRYRLEEFCGIYTRLMDDQQLPELAHVPAEAPLRRHCRALHEALTCWSEISSARIVNRAAAMGSNASKPYQAQLILAQGFAVPETLITNDPEAVRAFQRQHPRVIYKSISGVRSIVQTLAEADLARLAQIRWCPTQFQAFVDGTNVRVHTVGATVFATAIQTEATDYRYAHRQGSSVTLQAMVLPDALAERCLQLAHALGLAWPGSI